VSTAVIVVAEVDVVGVLRPTVIEDIGRSFRWVEARCSGDDRSRTWFGELSDVTHTAHRDRAPGGTEELRTSLRRLPRTAPAGPCGHVAYASPDRRASLVLCVGGS